MKKLFTLLFTAIVAFSLAMPVFAQETTGAATPKAEKKEMKEMKETKKAKKASKKKGEKKEEKKEMKEEMKK